jgi:hypothetical protein
MIYFVFGQQQLLTRRIANLTGTKQEDVALNLNITLVTIDN